MISISSLFLSMPICIAEAGQRSRTSNTKGMRRNLQISHAENIGKMGGEDASTTSGFSMASNPIGHDIENEMKFSIRPR